MFTWLILIIYMHVGCYFQDPRPTPSIGRIFTNSMEHKTAAVNNKCDTYLEYYDKKKSDEKLTKMRKENSVCITDHYYDLATDFYEYGWGESFHFAPVYKGDVKEQSFARHEYQLALRLGMKPGEKVVVSIINSSTALAQWGERSTFERTVRGQISAPA